MCLWCRICCHPVCCVDALAWDAPCQAPAFPCLGPRSPSPAAPAAARRPPLWLQPLPLLLVPPEPPCLTPCVLHRPWSCCVPACLPAGDLPGVGCQRALPGHSRRRRLRGLVSPRLARMHLLAHSCLKCALFNATLRPPAASSACPAALSSRPASQPASQSSGRGADWRPCLPCICLAFCLA